MSGGCAVGEDKGGDAWEAPAQEAEINFKLNLADILLNFEAFRQGQEPGLTAKEPRPKYFR